MDIGNGRRLVLAAPAGLEDKAPPGYVEFYDIGGVLDLLNSGRRDLTGHPGKDLPGQLGEDPYLNTLAFLRPDLAGRQLYAVSFCLPACDTRKIKRILDRGLLVVVYLNTERNHHGDYRRSKVEISWRRPEDFLSDDQAAWLKAYCETSRLYTEVQQAEPEPLAERVKKVKKTKTKAKDRKQKERLQNVELE